ncbi:phenazine biosynthesis protein PhzF family [Jatrophihabitans endophyticus]|uniref:Phenazine biosynthesis protein PhzF family n=1 Tax=Jatrophihabitans endophyticus TaxID=1206085 RepID=A0A1M5P8Z9_9ACTN|nr:PhzF family phenazine biosynthesis protein [Jatrophihabitans endophyticus]SHG98232.1 phenazine biosynthesis protein PhzF family [Jatrophihabitans endophyticus]
MLPFSQVDVFSDEFLLGNPVAVVHDADSLADDQLAAFARWTNLSETTFLLRPTDPAADYRLRIFTTARELPFAGHPTLGSARAWLAAGGTPARDGELVQQCGAGLVRLRRDGDRLAFAAPPLLRGGPVDDADVAAVAAAVGVDRAEVVDAQWCDNGPGWVALLLRDAERVLSLRPDATRFGRFPDIGVVGPYPDAGPDEPAFEVRAFLANDASGEDPVTGSLNAALAQWLVPAGHAPDRYVASQGTRLGRRGRVHVVCEGGEIWVGGDTVVGVRGEVALG